MDRKSKVDNAVRCQLIKETDIFLSPIRPDSYLRQIQPYPASACQFSTFRLNLVLTQRISSAFQSQVYPLHCQLPVRQSFVYQVMRLRSEGVHWRESTDVEPVSSTHGSSFVWLYLPTLFIGIGDMCISESIGSWGCFASESPQQD